MLTFDNIKLNNWRQFGSVDISFDKHVTVLTGPNGSGKTTIVNILGRHFGWEFQLVSTPFINQKSKKKLWSDFIKTLESEISVDSNDLIKVGSISYSNGDVNDLSTSRYVSSQYQLTFKNQKAVNGLLIPSHRPAISYGAISSIPTDPKKAQEHYEEFRQLLFRTYGSQNVRNPGLVLKQSLLSLALFGYGNEAVLSNNEFLDLFLEFQEILHKVLPPSLGFIKLEIRMPDVVLITKSGQFSLDAMSGGVTDIFAMAWQIHMFGSSKDSCTVIIDEPENHLHPSMQRSILPSLANAFPDYKFIIATHSPFILSSMPESKVIGLIYNDSNNVESTEIDTLDLVATPNNILREILDVPSNLPIWVEETIFRIIESTESLEGEERTAKIIEELDKLGLTDEITNIVID